MKTKTALLALLLAAALPFAAVAQVYVHGYTKKDGTYVQPHYRSSPNSTRADNYSSRGNVNPYTGQPGTRDPYAQPAQPYSRQSSYAQPANPYNQPRSSSNSSSSYSSNPYSSSGYGGSDDQDSDDDGGY